MILTNLNNQHINLNKVSYIGKPDTHVKAHIGVIIHFFLIVVDGYPIEIHAQTKEALEALREDLIVKCNVF